MKTKIKIVLLLAFIILYTNTKAQPVALQVPQIAGAFIHIFNPNNTRGAIDTTWYTNDHCFAKDAKGNWHAYGIIGHKPTDPWKGETCFFHISSPSLTQAKWTDNGNALTALKGKERVFMGAVYF